MKEDITLSQAFTIAYLYHILIGLRRCHFIFAHTHALRPLKQNDAPGYFDALYSARHAKPLSMPCELWRASMRLITMQDSIHHATSRVTRRAMIFRRQKPPAVPCRDTIISLPPRPACRCCLSDGIYAKLQAILRKPGYLRFHARAIKAC